MRKYPADMHTGDDRQAGRVRRAEEVDLRGLASRELMILPTR